MFGAGFYEGVSQAREQTRNRRAKVFQAFQQWKADNPYATAADFQNAVRAIGGGDLTVVGTLPGNQAIQRMAAENARKKQEAQKQQEFERLQKQLSMETTKLNLARTAVETYGDKADANQLAKQFGLPAEIFAPAFEQARSEAEARKAKEAQANNVKALEYYMAAANAALEAGRTPQEAHEAGLAASGRFASAAGFDLDLGAVGKPSGFQSGTSSHLADMQVTYDAKIQARSTAISEDLAKRIADNQAFLDQAVTDPSGAISAAALGIYDESDPAFAAALTDVEKRVKVLADQRKQEQDKADRDRASTAYATLSETTGQDLVLGREDDTRTAIINSLMGQGLTEERATAAADEVLSNNQPMLETAFDTQYNDPAYLQTLVGAEAAAAAQEFTSGMFGKDGLVKIGTTGVQVGVLGQSQIAQLMAGKVFYDEEERNTYFKELVLAAGQQLNKKGEEFASAAALEEAAYQAYEDKDMFPASVADYTQREELLIQQQDNFASTTEMGQADLERQLVADQDYDGVDIRESSIIDAMNIVGDNELRKAETAQIKDALVAAIADAEAYRDAIASGESLRIVDFGELPPEHRLGRGVQYDRAEHVRLINERIADLKRREAMITKQTGFETPLKYDRGTVNTPTMPVPLSNFVTNKQMGRDPKRPNSQTVIGSRDVMFSEAMNVPEPSMNLFADSIEATLKANPDTLANMPDLVAAVSSANSARDPYVVKALSDALEAYDFMRAFGEDNRVRGSAGASAFNRTMEEMGINIRIGTLTPETIDQAAREYAAQWVNWHLSDHDNFDALQQQIAELILLTEGREGMETDAGANFKSGYLDLPRARNTYGTGR